MGPKSYEEAGESPLDFTLINVKNSGQQTYIIVSGRNEVVAVRSVQLLRPRVFSDAHVV